MEANEDEDMSVMDAFEIAWHKFVDWACKSSREILSPTTAQFVEQAIRRPASLALLVINDKLKKRQTDDPEWEIVENRRKLIETRDVFVVKQMGLDLLMLTDLAIPHRMAEKFFDFCNVFVELIDEMNETSQ